MDIEKIIGFNPVKSNFLDLQKKDFFPLVGLIRYCLRTGYRDVLSEDRKAALNDLFNTGFGIGLLASANIGYGLILYSLIDKLN